MYDKQEPKVFLLVVALLGLGALLVFSDVAVKALFSREIENELRSKVVPDQNLLDVRTKGKEKLETYGWVNKEKNVAHIPVEKAIELVLKENQGNQDITQIAKPVDEKIDEKKRDKKNNKQSTSLKNKKNKK